MKTFERVWEAGILVAFLGLLGIAWVLYVQNQGLKREMSAARKAAAVPYPLTAVRPTFFDETEPIEGFEVPRRGDGRSLILVSSDSCAICEQNLTRWRHILTSAVASGVQSVLFITYDGGRISQSLITEGRRSGLTIELRRVKNRLAFSLRTGIIGVPHTMLLESDGKVLLTQDGLLSVDSASYFVEWMSEKRSHIASPFRRTDSQLMIVR